MRQKEFKISLLVLLISAFQFISAQQITVSGKVTDESGSPLPGVNVLVKGTSHGTATDFDGKYELTANTGEVLVFSFVGYTKKEVKVTSSEINVVLTEDTSTLDEVVVTAFGVTKKTKELGYSVSQIKTEDLDLTAQTDAVTALQGRVAGLQINRTSGGAGGGIDILIRGISSVNPERNNQPLIIIDGLAMNNDTFSGEVRPSAGSNSPSSAEQFSFTNRAADINPEDIESYNVLKGAAATALYGVRASNGAIVITTKKGKLGKPRINFTASTRFSKVRKTPELQDVYREGWRGRVEALYDPNSDTGYISTYPSTPFHSWGPKYSDDYVTNPDGNVIDLTNDKFYDPYELFRTGVTSILNFNIAGATEKIDYYFSVGNANDESIMPNTFYNRTTFRFNGGYRVSDNFKLSSSVSYTNSGGARATGGDKSVMSSLSYWSPTFPVNDYLNPDGTQRNYTRGIIDNPRYFLEKSNLKDDVNRWIGNVTMNWSPKSWVNVTYAAQVDNYSDQRNRFVPPDLDVGTQVGGFIVEQNINFIGLESNLLVAFMKDWTEKFHTTLTLGHQVSDSKRDYNSVRGESLNVPGVNDLSNAINYFASNSTTQVRNVGVFGELKMDYNNVLFLTVTGRNDWLSTLPASNRGFFYPSVSLAYDIHSLFGEQDVFSFGKLRASWAEVGKGPGFGKVGHYYIPDGDFPFGGYGGYRSSTALGDENIKPEKSRSFEVGADLRFFKNRLRFDYAYYKTRVSDQIFGVGTAYSSGLSRITRNAGDFETWGHELLVSGDVIRNEKFKWEMYLNFSTSEGVVIDLPDDIESIIFVSSGFAGVTSEVREGDKIGTLYGWKWRYENGERYIGSDGKPRVDFDSGRQIVGNAFPDYVASLGNNLTFGPLRFDFLVEYKKGGDLYDSGRRNSIRNGILKLTEFRNETTVLDGVMDDGNGGFVPNTQEVFIDQDYYRSSTRFNRASEILVQDASWVKIRNISLSFNFSGNFMDKLRMKTFAITAGAQNILLWTPFEGYDPEGNQYSAGSNVYGFTGLGTPLTESYSLGINIGF